jgi:hypothetical protein
MADSERYNASVEPISRDQLDLFECLVRIDRGELLDARAHALLERLVEGGLVDRDGSTLTLTAAGVERCRALQHRIASDKEAARILAERGLAEAVAHSR